MQAKARQGLAGLGRVRKEQTDIDRPRQDRAETGQRFTGQGMIVPAPRQVGTRGAQGQSKPRQGKAKQSKAKQSNPLLRWQGVMLWAGYMQA
jgi:hypothetical protein